MCNQQKTFTCSVHGTAFVQLGHWRLCPDCPNDAVVLASRFAPDGYVLIRKPELTSRGQPAIRPAA